jgi:EAL domain-containing protein (putative c-di-GMP-specific phosphodiesterase class I)
VVAPKHAKTVDETVNAARAALESAITAGRRGFVAYQPSPRMENQRRENLATSDLLMRCLHDKKLDLVFQPIVLADTRQTAYYEALVRLTGEEGVLEAAGDVIALAERLDLVRLLDQQVLELVEQEIIKYPTAKMAMNVSAKTLIDPIWQSQLASFLQNNRGVCERVTLELTESAILNNLDEAIEFMKMLKDQGCSIAIDDFGSGHTSFAKLKKLPVDLVKIDGAFIRQMRDEPDDDIFPRVLCDLAKSLGLKTVAEWVETEEQAERLAELGIDYFQGTLFGEGTQQPQWRQIQGSAA